MLFPLLGPPGPTDNACLLLLVIIFGLEMLGLVNFDNENCYTMVPNCPRCQIVRGAKLSVVPNCPLLPMVPNCPPTWAVPNCPWCQIVLVPNCPRTFQICCTYYAKYATQASSHNKQRNTTKKESTKQLADDFPCFLFTQLTPRI